jgi:hypothetical protein
LSIVLIIAWLYISQPSLETLLAGKIKLTRSEGTTMADWFSYSFFYEFDTLQETNLTIKFKQEGPGGEVFWYLFNTTKRTIEIKNATRGDFSVAEGATSQLERTISLKNAGNYTFVLFLAQYSYREAVTVMLELYKQ